MKCKTIAILGVDGSGKSTVIENVAARLKERCVVKYMGSRSYENPELEKLLNKNKMTKIEIIRSIWLRYLCFWSRYLSAINTGKIVLFDRYIHEIYLNAFGIYKPFYTILYKYLYPSPSCIIYLHCPADVSLSRKEDIPDPDVFRAMKARFDSCFLNKKGCFCINSEEYNSQELADIVYNYIITKYGNE